MAGITATLYREPYTFFSGGAVESQVPAHFAVAIGGHAYAVDLNEYQRETVDAFRTPIDSNSEPGEQSMNIIGVWKRQCSHWELGAGQTHYDERDSSPERFNISKGVDPWTLRTLRLHKATEAKTGMDGTTTKLYAVGNDYAYLLADGGVEFTEDPSQSSPTMNTVALGGAVATDLTSDGDTIYIATDTGILSVAVGDTSTSAFSAYVADIIEFANGTLIAAAGNELVEVAGDGSTTELTTHFNASFAWTTIAGTPAGVFVAGNSGDRGEFYFVGFNAGTGALAVPIAAGTLPRGEFINVVEFYQGALLLGTSKGFRIAAIVQDRGVGLGPVITAPGDVKCIAVDGEYAWFGWSNFDASSSGIGRAWLARTTEPGVPPYASDLMADATGAVSSVISFDGRRYFTVGSSGTYGEDDSGTLVTSGYVESGLIRYGTFEHKNVVAASVHHEPLDGSVSLTIINENGTEISAGTSSTAGSVMPSAEFGAGGAAGEEIELRVTLTRSGSDSTLGPVLTRWMVRASIVPLMTDSILVPIILKTKVKNLVGEGQDVTFDPLDEYRYLKTLESARIPVVYQEGAQSERVIVDKVMVRPEKWIHPSHRWFEGKVYVRLLTVQPVSEG